MQKKLSLPDLDVQKTSKLKYLDVLFTLNLPQHSSNVGKIRIKAAIESVSLNEMLLQKPLGQIKPKLSSENSFNVAKFSRTDRTQN